MIQSAQEIRVIVEQAWRQVLGGEGGYADTDDFFQLGGHSLLALHVADTLQTKLGRPVSVRTLFAKTKVADLVAALEAA